MNTSIDQGASVLRLADLLFELLLELAIDALQSLLFKPQFLLPFRLDLQQKLLLLRCQGQLRVVRGFSERPYWDALRGAQPDDIVLIFEHVIDLDEVASQAARD